MSAEPPVWVQDYIGIPFRDLGRDRHGCDCFGLLRLVLAERAGIVLPRYDTAYGSEADVVAVRQAMDGAAAGGDWMPIASGDERAYDVVEMTVVVAAYGRAEIVPTHVGVVVAPGWLLHTARTTGALLGRYRDDPAVRARIVAFWRFRGQATAPRGQDGD